MSAINADLVKISVYDGTPTPVKKVVARQTELSFNRSRSEIEVSSKQSGDYADFVTGGRKSGEISFDAYIETAPAVGEVSEGAVDALYESGAAAKWAIESTVTGTRSREFFAIVTKFDLKYTMQSGAMYSVTLRMTGAPTTTVVA